METPLILAIETAGQRGGLALYQEGLIAEINFYAKQSYSTILFEYLPKILQQTNKRLQDIQYIAVDVGPGSFTGLRIGLSVVKALSLVGNFPILPIISLESLAFRFWGTSLPIVSLIDAYTKEVYVGIYKHTPAGLVTVKEPTLLFYKEVPKLIQERALFVSESLEKWENFLSSQLGDLFVKPPFKVSLKASLLSELAWVKWQRGELLPLDAEAIFPLYLKASEAERKKCSSTL